MQANDTSVRLSKAREVYRPVAARGALMYFLVDALSALDRVYHYTMATFVSIMVKGAQRVPLQPIDFIGSLSEQKPYDTVLCALQRVSSIILYPVTRCTKAFTMRRYGCNPRRKRWKQSARIIAAWTRDWCWWSCVVVNGYHHPKNFYLHISGVIPYCLFKVGLLLCLEVGWESKL